MKNLKTLSIIVSLIALGAGGDHRAADVVGSAKEFLTSLDKNQRRRAVMSFGADYRTHWRYTPASREGVSWSDLNAVQTIKAHALIKATLSDLGYERTQTVRTLEAVLEDIEGNPGRDKDEYFFTFFGIPDKSARWGLRYEGHHVSLNFTFDGEKMVSSTPQFFGANPAEVSGGTHKGLRMLEMEEDHAIHFLSTLTDGQRRKAIIAPNAPSDIFTSENSAAMRQSNTGLSYQEMTQAQQTDLMGLIMLIARTQRSTEFDRRMSEIKSAGLDKIVFAWMGARDRSAPHYFRIQGPTFIIEFDNTQNRANHIHLVWRDFECDFGRDLLNDHYADHQNDPRHGHER